MIIKEREEALVKVGEELGGLMAQASPEDKNILQQIKKAVEKYAAEMEEKGKCVDRSSMYAVAVILDDNLNASDNLIECAKRYIDADYEYIMSLKDAVE
ncbi:MAG: hypothetical protein K8T10_17750 [Candidatus Eremiobacteraeota bacterium]|nr:hypothetical protein [Candidatus Eremiobacteraeota bacterium]